MFTLHRQLLPFFLVLLLALPALGALTNTTSRVTYPGTGALSSFDYTFKVFDDDDLEVVVRLIATGVETTLAKTTHYTVTGVASSTGGSVELVNGSFVWQDSDGDLLSTYEITIRRKVELTQATSIKNQGAYYPVLHENAFDKLTMGLQQHQDELNRCLKVPFLSQGESTVSLTLPSASERASSYLAFDASGSPIAGSSFTGGTSASAYIQTLLDDANASTARTTLGATAGVWPESVGGTAQSSYTAGDLLYASATNTLSKKAVGSNGDVLSVSAGLPAYVAPSDDRSPLLNTNFDYWQRGTSVTVANTVSTYEADRWYVKNSLGTNGVITFSRVAGSSDGALYGASVKITTAPTAAQVNGTELYQTLDNATSRPYYNKTASFTIKVKALGNVTQAGVQFYYKTTEAKVDTAIGSEQTCTVNTSTFVSCTINGQALGTSMTSAGVVGVRVRVTGASTGNAYDLNNGFVVEQAMMNLGSYARAWAPAFRDSASEIQALQRYYEKSYDIATDPGTVTTAGAPGPRASTTAAQLWHCPFKARKRTTSVSVNVYSTGTGTISKIRDTSGAADINSSTSNLGEAGVSIGGSVTDSNGYAWQWTADAEI